LDQLVDKLERKGVRGLTAAEAMELPKLYQAQVSSLAVARNIVLDKNLLEYLENLSLRAYLSVYGPRQGLGECLASFLSSGFPGAVRALRLHVLVAALIFFAGSLSGCLMVLADNELYSTFIDPELAQGRDYSSTPGELLSEELFTPWSGFADNFIHFANFLFRHNTVVSLFCFGLGFCLGIPTVLLLFTNGLTVGAMMALHIDKGLGFEFFGWLSIHGVTELTAVVLASAGGLAIGQAVIFPGNKPRVQNLASQGLLAAQLMIGAMVMLFLAGILEGGFRQLLANTPLRLLVAAITAVFWWAYFTRCGREASSQAPLARPGAL
jgi:uncharacterized membrane protein SpoIIM required for sporulation